MVTDLIKFPIILKSKYRFTVILNIFLIDKKIHSQILLYVYVSKYLHTLLIKL